MAKKSFTITLRATEQADSYIKAVVKEVADGRISVDDAYKKVEREFDKSWRSWFVEVRDGTS